MARQPKADADRTVRCPATEGAQRCLREQHPVFTNHTWGAKGETAQWHADGTPKDPGPVLERLNDGRLRDRATGRFVSTPDPEPSAPRDRWLEMIDAKQAQKAIAATARRAARARGEVLPPAVTPADVADMERAGRTNPDLRLNGEVFLADFDRALDALTDPEDGIRAAYSDARFLVDLALERFDHEAAAFEATAERLVAEISGRSRFLVFAAAAQAAGHHPAAAYYYAADHLDPAGVA